MSFSIHFTGVESTPAIHSAVEEKIASLRDQFEGILSIKVDVGLRSKHHNKGDIFYAEATVGVGQSTVRVEKDADDLYKAIDMLRDQLKMELDKEKDRANAIDRNAIRDTKAFHAE